MNEAIEEAISIAGGVTALANGLGIVRSAVSNWRASGVVPADKCKRIEQMTGVAATRLRPDVFLMPQ